ncbi:MAG: hypothetical protein OIF40_10800 [Mangrovicoccus sp.]|nr:hypothetical protein [Mangrovicoccus sp.]
MLSTGLTLSALTPSPASAKQIERACMASDRRAATQSTCRCIQRVADQILTRPDQRKAAKFFKDPDEAQKVRMSDANRDEKFWTRYKDFGNTAIAVCG